MQGKGILIGLAVLLIVAVAGFFLTQGKDKNAVVASPTPVVTGFEVVASPVTDSGQTNTQPELAVEGNEYNFVPKAISLKAGESVKVKFKNMGTLPHNLVVSDLNVATKTIGKGQEDTVTIKADKAGTYTFYCSVGNHRQMGMEGMMEVK